MASLSRKNHPRMLRSGQSALGCGYRNFDVAFIYPSTKQQGPDWVTHVINVSAGRKAGTEAVSRTAGKISHQRGMKGVCRFGQKYAWLQENCKRRLGAEAEFATKGVKRVAFHGTTTNEATLSSVFTHARCIHMQITNARASVTHAGAEGLV